MESTSTLSAEALTSIPFEFNFNHPYVQVRVEDSEPLWFILDTGAQVMVVDTGAAQRIGLDVQPLNQAGAGGGEGTVELSIARDVALEVGGLRETYPTVYVLDLDSALSSHEGRPVNGLLGYNFFKRYVVEMDHVGHRIDLYDPATYRYAGPGEEIPFHLVNNHPHVQGSIVPEGREPLPADFVIDTGATGAVYLATPYVNRHALLAPGIKTRTGFVGGVGGLTRQAVGRVSAVRFGPASAEHPLVYFSQDQRGGFAGLLGADGIIGSEILRRYTVIWNYALQHLTLEPNIYQEEPFHHDIPALSGCYLVAEGDDLKTVRVQHIIEDSPAAGAGLQTGDVILAINEIPASFLTLEHIRQLFLTEKAYTLHVQRGAERFATAITLKQLL